MDEELIEKIIKKLRKIKDKDWTYQELEYCAKDIISVLEFKSK